MTAILEFDPLTASGLHDAAGDSATVFDSLDALVVRAGQVSAHGTIVLGPSVETDLALDYASSMRRSDPTAGPSAGGGWSAVRAMSTPAWCS